MPEAPITLCDMIYEVRREVDYRRMVWSEACRTGRMNRRQADRRLDVMRTVLARLIEIQKGEVNNGDRDQETHAG